MKKIITTCFALFVCFAVHSFAQIPTTVLVQIVKAEDERRFDKTLEDLMKNRDERIRARAALAAGRIGDESAVAPLVNILETDSSTEVRTMAAFALGEIESIKAADAIIKNLADTKVSAEIRARSVEAAGKIAAANQKDEKSKQLGAAILQTLVFENEKRSKPFESVIELALTAVLRARPVDAETTLVKFIDAYTPPIRANALNALARLRAKNANEKSRGLLQTDADPIVRANAARVLGAAEDADSFDLLLKAATTDADSRVRVSAIRSLGSLKAEKAAEKLLERGATLLADYMKFKATNPNEKSELLEIATTLGRILPNSNDEKAINFLKQFRISDNLQSPEIEIAFAVVAPEKYLEAIEQTIKTFSKTNWRSASSLVQGLAEMANLPDEKKYIRMSAMSIIGLTVGSQESHSPEIVPAIPDYLRAYAAFKKDISSPEFFPLPPNGSPRDLLSESLRGYITYKEKTPPEEFRLIPKDNRILGYNDVFVRAAAAELLGEQTATEENLEALKTAFVQALEKDKDSNDAQLAILSALVKSDKTQAASSLQLALAAPDYLVRKHAANLIKENDLSKDFPNAEAQVGTVKPYNATTKTKLGQIFYTNADYTRAVSRRNARAILTTEKGTFTIEFFPEDAPLTVDNFIRLAKANYFDGLAIHRVVPNFVMQDGDPRGDGNGGPGWQIRCELNMKSYERGAVGMALSGKDTGGSQWFVTHSPAPHLDGGYTVFGRVNETDMKIVDTLVRGDKILTVKIVEGSLPQKSAKGRKK